MFKNHLFVQQGDRVEPEIIPTNVGTGSGMRCPDPENIGIGSAKRLWPTRPGRLPTLRSNQIAEGAESERKNAGQWRCGVGLFFARRLATETLRVTSFPLRAPSKL